MDKKNLWQQRLAQSRTELDSVLNNLSPDQWQLAVFSEGQTWTIQDVVAHLAENEQGMSIHIYKIRKGRKTIPDGFDLTNWNTGLKERVGNVTPQQLRQKMTQVRERTVQEMTTLKDEEWSLTGYHPARGNITIEQYYETIAAHETIHTNDIKQALKG